jgi:hypothetical protein
MLPFDNETRKTIALLQSVDGIHAITRSTAIAVLGVRVLEACIRAPPPETQYTWSYRRKHLLRADHGPLPQYNVRQRDTAEVKQLKVKLAASPQSPIVNPAFVVANWASDQTATVLIDDKQPDDSIDIRQGVVRRANGVNALVVWIEKSTTEALKITIE